MADRHSGLRSEAHASSDGLGGDAGEAAHAAWGASASEPDWVLRLTPLRAEVEIEAVEALELPEHAGGMLRGALARALQRSTCAWRPPCVECRSPLTCPYTYLFETPPPPDTRRLRRYPKAPHPLVVEPPEEGARTLAPGERFRFGLVLVGRATALLPFVVHALECMARTGLARGRARTRVGAVWQATPTGMQSLFDASTGAIAAPAPRAPLAAWRVGGTASVMLRFRTPTRLVREGRLVGAPAPRDLVAALLRRLSSLHYFHCGGLDLPLDFPALLEAAARLRVVASDLRWQEWRRHSSRQGRHVAMGGFVGDLALAGDLGPLASCLRLGEALHVGKGTIFGQGRYEILAGHA